RRSRTSCGLPAINAAGGQRVAPGVRRRTPELVEERSSGACTLAGTWWTVAHNRGEESGKSCEGAAVVAVLDERILDVRRLEEPAAGAKRDHTGAWRLAFDPPDAAEALDVHDSQERSPSRPTDHLAPARSPVHQIRDVPYLLAR